MTTTEPQTTPEIADLTEAIWEWDYSQSIEGFRKVRDAADKAVKAMQRLRFHIIDAEENVVYCIEFGEEGLKRVQEVCRLLIGFSQRMRIPDLEKLQMRYLAADTGDDGYYTRDPDIVIE